MNLDAPADYKELQQLPEFTRIAMLNLLGQGTGVDIHETQGKVTPLGLDVIADVSWEETHGTGKDQRTVTIHRTLAFMHRPEFKLPRFELTNAEGLLSKWIHKGSGTTDMAKLQFPDRTELHKRYTITSPIPDSCRLVFTDAVLDGLEKHDGMDGIANHNGVLTWRGDDRLLDGANRAQLAIDTKAIFTSILDDPDAGQQIADAMPGSYADEMMARLEADGSKKAMQLLEAMVRREHVEHLASQAPPRVPDSSIVKRTLGMNTAVIVTGVLLAGIAFPVSITGLVLYPLFSWPAWWIALAISLIGITGSFMIIFGIRWRKRRLWILTRGQWIETRILSVDATNSTSNKEILHEVSFQGVGRDDVNVKISLGTDPSRIARTMMYNEETTHILVDPDHPDRGIWLHGWVVENIPD